MSEAYEIGVTLALGDGVSVGIAQARRDIAQLKQVLQAGGVSVQQLRAASVAALSVTASSVSRRSPVGGDVAPKEPVVPPVVETASGLGLMAAGREAAPAAQQGEEAGGQPVAAAAIVAPLRDVAPTAGSVRDVAPPSTPRAAPALPRRETADWVAPAEQPEQTPTLQVVQRGAAPISTAPLSLAAIGAAARDVRPAPSPVSQNAGASAEDVPAVVAAAVAQPEMRAPDRPGVVNAMPRGWGQVAGPVWGARAGVDGVAARMTEGPATSAAAPERSPGGRSAAGEGSATDGSVTEGGATEGGATAQAPTAPPIAASTGPTEGDVFLDGALVGRWISRFLTQQAGRASAGPTGFDPRRGRLLPGATVGG